MSVNFSDMWQPAAFLPTGESVPLSAWGLVGAIGMAMTGSLFSSDAWNNIGFSGDEIVRPERTIVLSMAIGTAIVTGLYMLINLVYLLVLPLQGTPRRGRHCRARHHVHHRTTWWLPPWRKVFWAGPALTSWPCLL